VNAKQARYAAQLLSTTLKTRAALAARPWTVKLDGRFFGRYASEGEARARADAIGGTYEKGTP